MYKSKPAQTKRSVDEKNGLFFVYGKLRCSIIVKKETQQLVKVAAQLRNYIKGKPRYKLDHSEESTGYLENSSSKFSGYLAKTKSASSLSTRSPAQN